MSRYFPRLERWATGRLPSFARSVADTSDLVQEALLKVMEGIKRVEDRGPGFFQAYMRQAILNRIRDLVRQAKRRPTVEGLPESLVDASPSPLESAIGTDVWERYERAMEQLTEEERQFLHLRCELDFSYEEIAPIMGRDTRDAARMAVHRSFKKLAEIMGNDPS